MTHRCWSCGNMHPAMIWYVRHSLYEWMDHGPFMLCKNLLWNCKTLNVAWSRWHDVSSHYSCSWPHATITTGRNYNWPLAAIVTDWRVLPWLEPTPSIFLTTSIPSVTWPNTTCLPSNLDSKQLIKILPWRDNSIHILIWLTFV